MLKQTENFRQTDMNAIKNEGKQSKKNEGKSERKLRENILKDFESIF